MPIEGFEYKEFAKSLAQQASEIVPPDISKPDKDYIINLILQFCNMSGEALYNDTENDFDAESAYMITQFIGEWTYHKSIDLIHGKIPRQYRDRILQQIAFTAFEIAKLCIKKNMPREEIIQVVEAHVVKTYKNALVELQKKGALSAEQANNAANLSNLDDMAKNDPIANADDTKLLKLYSLAVLLKSMPQEKAETILSKLNPDHVAILRQYLSTDDLETKLDASIMSKYLSEIKTSMPEPIKVSMSQVQRRFDKIVSVLGKDNVSTFVSRERPYIKSLLSPNGKEVLASFPPRVADVICQHLEEKVK